MQLAKGLPCRRREELSLCYRDLFDVRLSCEVSRVLHREGFRPEQQVCADSLSPPHPSGLRNRLSPRGTNTCILPFSCPELRNIYDIMSVYWFPLWCDNNFGPLSATCGAIFPSRLRPRGPIASSGPITSLRKPRQIKFQLGSRKCGPSQAAEERFQLAPACSPPLRRIRQVEGQSCDCETSDKIYAA